FFVRRVRRQPSGVADGRRPHARHLPELPFGAPETAHAEHRALIAVGKRRLDRMAGHEMLVRDAHLGGSPGERLLRPRHPHLLRCKEHSHAYHTSERREVTVTCAVVELLGICGSMRKASHNRALLEALREALPSDTRLAIWESLDLPIFS